MSWFDILKEPLISVPKSIVSMKKPKKVEIKEDCKERLGAFIEKVKSIVPSGSVYEPYGPFTKYIEGMNRRNYYYQKWDEVSEEVACKIIEMLRKEANNKDYADGGVTYRGKFPKVREKHGNMSRLAEVDDYEIEVEFAKSDMALTNRMENRGRLLIYVFSGSKKLYLLRVYLRIGDVVEPDTATVAPPPRARPNEEQEDFDNYDKIKAVIP
tara:strand:- start:337 stop:972 length:636 start_codon:yes stop_codon:yes gene_type:complete